MYKNCWFEHDETEIDTKVEDCLLKWKGMLRDPGHSNYYGYGSMEKLIEHKRIIFRQKVVTDMNEEELLKTNKTNLVVLRREMKEEFKKVNDTLLELIHSVKELNKSCSKMDSHINFVEDTYETLRTPLDYITSKVNSLRGVENGEELPYHPMG